MFVLIEVCILFQCCQTINSSTNEMKNKTQLYTKVTEKNHCFVAFLIKDQEDSFWLASPSSQPFQASLCMGFARTFMGAAA